MDCNFIAPYGNYTDSVVCDLLSGIYDIEICREVLSDPTMATRPINISAIESKESAHDALAAPASRPVAEAAAASSFRPQGKPSASTAPPRLLPKTTPHNQNHQQEPQRSTPKNAAAWRLAALPLLRLRRILR